MPALRMRASATSRLPSGALAGALGIGAAADVVPVLGQVGQVAEIGEGADHAHRLGRADSALSRFLSARSAAWSASRRKATDSVRIFSTSSIALLALLLADHVAEDAAEQADVVDQRLFVRLLRRLGARSGGRGCFHSEFLLVGPGRRTRCCGATC